MQMNALNMRFAAVAGGLVLFGLFMLAGGNEDKSPGVLIVDFSSDPELLQGLEIEIDGEPAGKLEIYGQHTRTAFPVGYGTHEVTVAHGAIPTRAATVHIEHPTQREYLMLNLADLTDYESGDRVATFFFDQ